MAHPPHPTKPRHSPADLPPGTGPTSHLLIRQEWVLVDVANGHRRGVRTVPDEETAYREAQRRGYEVELVTFTVPAEDDDPWFNGPIDTPPPPKKRWKK